MALKAFSSATEFTSLLDKKVTLGEGEKEVMVCVGKLLIVMMCVGMELVMMVLGEGLVEIVLQELVVMISLVVEEVTMVLELELVVVMMCVQVKEASLEAEPLWMPEAWEDLEATHGVILSA